MFLKSWFPRLNKKKLILAKVTVHAPSDQETRRSEKQAKTAKKAAVEKE